MRARLIIFSSNDANMRYASGMNIPDPFIWCELAGKEYLLVNQLEYGRAKTDSKRGTKIVLWDDVKLDTLRITGRSKNLADIASAFVLSFSATQIEIPQNTWTVHYQTLQEHGLRPKVTTPFFEERKIKSPEQIKLIKKVGLATKQAYNRAIEVLKESTIEWDDTLTYRNQKVTSEFLKKEIESTLLENGCQSGETIVACGEQSAQPHNRGEGPIYAGQPIIFDLFPHDQQSGYYFDMTRTVVKGTPSKELRAQYNAVKKAQHECLEMLQPGPAKSFHKICADTFTQLGYKTTTEEGFIHSTGHSLGVDIHESPKIGEKSDEKLEAGMVVTIEPGLYYKETGGVRIEDTVVITKDGHTNLTNIPKTLVVK